MDLLCYDDIKYLFLKKKTNVIFVMIIFLKILYVKDALLYVVQHISIGFIFLTITAAPCADFNVTVFQLAC